MAAGAFTMYADMAGTFPFEESATAAAGGEGRIVREPVGVVGAIVPWNGADRSWPVQACAGAARWLHRRAEGRSRGAERGLYLIAEAAEAIGLPPGILNVVTADREVSELLVRDARIDKIGFTGSTAAGRRIATLLGDRIGRLLTRTGREVRCAGAGRCRRESAAATNWRGRVPSGRPGVCLAHPA
jgi:aldehyde dehydrogenase (NAD+)